jgi:hypothetical protein
MMNKKTLGIILALTGLVVLSFGLFTYIHQTTSTQTDTLHPLESKTFKLDLAPGYKVQGTLTVLDGNEGIAVFIENPDGEVIYNGGTVYSNVEFSFDAQKLGKYFAAFTNLSPTNEQKIEYSFTYPALPSLISLAVTIIGVFLLLIGVTFLVILHKASMLGSKQ